MKSLVQKSRLQEHSMRKPSKPGIVLFDRILVALIAAGVMLASVVAQAQGKKAPRGPGNRPPAQNNSPGANLQPKTVFVKFPDWVECVTFSPDSKILAAGSYGVVKLLDVHEQQETASFPDKGGFVKTAAFSADGKLLVTGGYQSLKLWDVATGKVLRAFKGHRGYVTAAAFSADQKTLVSAADDETVNLWNLESGERTLKLPELGQPALALAISANGQFLAVGTGDVDRPTKRGTVCVFDKAQFAGGKHLA
jgi:WD40 repeat protein